MADRPIIFSGPMVQALLAGRKSQTRRVLKPQPYFLLGRMSRPHEDDEGRWVQTATDWVYSQRLGNYEPERERDIPLRLPYAIGDRLWVRETVCWVSGWGWRYRADNDDLAEKRETGEVSRWRPSIHMPRWASRLTLTVTDVRVQRLQDISELDAVAEGIERLKSGRGFYDPTVSHAAVRFGEWTSTARQGFCRLWNSLHGPGAWDANPWVVALTFNVQRGNIDQIGGENG